jgi:hypothetical protein
MKKLILIVIAASMACGCAMFEEDNRRVLNSMDGAIHPETTWGRIAMAPAGVVVGTAGLATDALVVHPAHQIPKAWDDTVELCWEFGDMSPLRQTVLFPLRVGATPPTFVVDWLCRSMFDSNW